MTHTKQHPSFSPEALIAMLKAHNILNEDADCIEKQASLLCNAWDFYFKMSKSLILRHSLYFTSPEDCISSLALAVENEKLCVRADEERKRTQRDGQC